MPNDRRDARALHGTVELSVPTLVPFAVRAFHLHVHPMVVSMINAVG